MDWFDVLCYAQNIFQINSLDLIKSVRTITNVKKNLSIIFSILYFDLASDSQYMMMSFQQTAAKSVQE